MTLPTDYEQNAPSGEAARLPALGTPEPSPAFLARVKEIIETLLGRRGGSKWDQAVTFRDLYSMGLATPGQQVLVLPASGAAAGNDTGLPGSFDQQLAGRLETALRNSAAYKELQRRIGSAEDLEQFPDELRVQLQQALGDLARQRGADIQTLERKIQNNTMSLASRLTEITASLNDTAAGVRHFDASYADKTKALATSITQVNASIGDLGGATVEEKFLAQADVNDGLKAQWSLKVVAGTEANPVFAGIGLSAESPTAGTGTSSIIFQADKFGFFTSGGNIMPFGISGSTVYVNGLLKVGSATGQTLGALTDSMINYVGDFASAPAAGSYRFNDVYKNTTDGNSYINYDSGGGTHAWKVFIAKGGAGTNGTRGTVQIVASGSSWSDSTANSAISSATGTGPVNRDQVTITNNTSFSQTRFYDSGSWLVLNAWVNGNMVVDGTLSASKITTGTLSADRINGGTITGSAINLGGGNFQVNTSGNVTMFGGLLTRCSASNSGLPTAAALTVSANAVGGSGPGLVVSATGNAIEITGGANGIVQNGGGANFMKSILAISDNAFDIGGSANRFVNVWASSGVISTSDKRTKFAIKDSSLGLAFINDLRPVQYRRKDAQKVVTEIPRKPTKANPNPAPRIKTTTRKGTRTHYGLLTQEVRETLLSHGAEDAAIWGLADKDDPDSLQWLRYEGFIAPLIRAVQELSARCDELESTVRALQQPSRKQKNTNSQ